MHILLVLRFTTETFFTAQCTRALAAMHITVQMEGSPIQIQGFPWETGIHRVVWNWHKLFFFPTPWVHHGPDVDLNVAGLLLTKSTFLRWLFPGAFNAAEFGFWHSDRVLGFTWVAESEFREQLIPRPLAKKWRARCVLVMDFGNTEDFF